MPRILLDTNILLDYFGVCENPAHQDDAVALIRELAKSNAGFIVTPAILKDFQYIFSNHLKRITREQTGALTAQNAAAIAQCRLAAADLICELGTVASEGQGDCAVARSLCRQHDDFEENLIAAVALRIKADCIVTRDKSFAAHCPVSCLLPRDVLALVTEGIFQ